MKHFCLSFCRLFCSWLRVMTLSRRLATLPFGTLVGEVCKYVCGCKTTSRSSQRLDFFTWQFDSSTGSSLDWEQARRFLMVSEKPTTRLKNVILLFRIIFYPLNHQCREKS